MYLLPFMVIIETIIAYQWLEYNDHYDCVVGVSIDGNPVGVGVFISTWTVLTSANPLNHIRKANISRVKIHYVNGIYNESYVTSVIKIVTRAPLSRSNEYFWVPMGIEATENSCIDDFALLFISRSGEIFPIIKDKLLREDRSANDKGRRPYPIKLPNITPYHLPTGTEFAYAGFGYLDEEHVQNNTALEVSYYSEDTLTECDEWIPREWGWFICILDEHDSYSIASGAPLFADGDTSTFYGIGCFSLKKGREKLHVFTDLEEYSSLLNIWMLKYK